jgi:hypothetical protein
MKCHNCEKAAMFGLIDNVGVAGLLATAFGRAKERHETSRTSSLSDLEKGFCKIFE